MKDASIAIHEHGGGWTPLWFSRCQDLDIPHKRVNCYDSDIMAQLRDCSALLWHISHSWPVDMLIGRTVLNAAEMMGLQVFPNYYANWHFDDKLSQKYLFEAIKAPCVPTWAFFDQAEALDFAATCDLPIVAKLRRGSASYNVRLLRSRREMRSYIRRMFGKGYSPAPAVLADASYKFRSALSRGGWQGVAQRLKKAPRFFRVMSNARRHFGNEKGYVYFQKFLPGNTCDLRISVVGDRAWAYRRLTRPQDFRASGSGQNRYEASDVPQSVIMRSFEVAQQLRMQSVCFDWVIDGEGAYHFVETSFGFVDDYVYNCPGFWDSSGDWHEGHFHPAWCVLDDLVSTFGT